VNTVGDHKEYWQHSGGCRSHLVVVRSTLTHVISPIGFAREHEERKSAVRHKSGEKA